MAKKPKKADDEQPEAPAARRSCATMQVHERLLRTVPGYREVRDLSENQALRAAMYPMAGRTGCTRIPVVVHVVYKTAAQNVSDAQIKSQIDVLNADFRKKNSDVSTVPAAFAPLAADTRIEFELAKTDPSGNPTTGITRTATSVNGFSDDDAVKSASSGGADAWPADKYLNIWVCQLAGGLLGYAQFPGGPAATDGVVILHSAFGTTGTAAAPFNLGRTTTHEVGHWLNLRHIWGDDGTGCSGSDFVADTPNQGGPNYGTPSFPHVSCSNGPNGDMFMNYMDYVDDAAMVMFSSGQVTRMQAALDGLRSAIGTAIPCGGIKPLPKDIIKEPIKDPKDLPKDLPARPPKDCRRIPEGLARDPEGWPKDPPRLAEGSAQGVAEGGRQGPAEGPGQGRCLRSGQVARRRPAAQEHPGSAEVVHGAARGLPFGGLTPVQPVHRCSRRSHHGRRAVRAGDRRGCRRRTRPTETLAAASSSCSGIRAAPRGGPARRRRTGGVARAAAAISG